MNAVPFPTFEAELLLVYSTPSYAKGTKSKMRQVLAELRELGIATVDQLTRPLVDRYKLWLPAKESRPVKNANTLNSRLSYLRAACHFAEDWGYLERSPFGRQRAGSRTIFLRKQKPSAKQHHSREDLARVFAHLRTQIAGRLVARPLWWPTEYPAGSTFPPAGWAEREAQLELWRLLRLHAFFATALYCGLRRNEALRLHPEDVHLDGDFPFLDISPRSRLKTEGSAAPIPIPPILVPTLREWLPLCRSEYLFPGTTGTCPWSGESGRRPLDELKEAGAAVGVHGLTIQSLRHSWATHSVHFGLSRSQRQQVLRHTRPMTQDEYIHPDLPNLAEAVQAVNFEPCLN